MLSRKKHVAASFLTLLISAVISTTCIVLPVLGEEMSDESVKQGYSIGILPFFKGQYASSATEIFDTPVSDFSHDSEMVSEESARILAGIAYEELNEKLTSGITPLLYSTIIYDRLQKEESETIRNLAQKAGKSMKVREMIVGYVWKYKRRVGSSMAASIPASVGFSIAIIDVSTGEILWKGNFEESQKPLSENLLELKGFFKKGMKWVTAEDLARYGIREILDKQPVNLK